MGEVLHRRYASPVPGGAIHYALHLPQGYDEGSQIYPTAYLLHGRGDSMSDWRRVLGDLDELIAAALVPPLIAVMPDAPWSSRAGYYIDSLFADPGAAAIETTFTTDLIADVDNAFRSRAVREGRMVGGYVTAELHLYRGGHDWGVWRPAFRDGLQSLLGSRG